MEVYNKDNCIEYKCNNITINKFAVIHDDENIEVVAILYNNDIYVKLTMKNCNISIQFTSECIDRLLIEPIKNGNISLYAPNLKWLTLYNEKIAEYKLNIKAVMNQLRILNLQEAGTFCIVQYIEDIMPNLKEIYERVSEDAIYNDIDFPKSVEIYDSNCDSFDHHNDDNLMDLRLYKYWDNKSSLFKGIHKMVKNLYMDIDITDDEIENDVCYEKFTIPLPNNFPNLENAEFIRIIINMPFLMSLNKIKSLKFTDCYIIQDKVEEFYSFIRKVPNVLINNLKVFKPCELEFINDIIDTKSIKSQ